MAQPVVMHGVEVCLVLVQQVVMQPFEGHLVVGVTNSGVACCDAALLWCSLLWCSQL